MIPDEAVDNSRMTITEFLLERIAEDEDAANRCVSALVVPDALAWTILDPARVLAECAAKRAIIAAHPIVDDVVEVSTRIKWGFACETCFSYGDIVEDHGYCDTLRALTSVYADHADYDEGWAL